jgi:uncharacterized protein
MTTKAQLRLVGERTLESGAQESSVQDSSAHAGWAQVSSDLNAHGSAVLQKLLTPRDCERLAARYGDDNGFRSRIVMSRHGFG